MPLHHEHYPAGVGRSRRGVRSAVVWCLPEYSSGWSCHDQQGARVPSMMYWRIWVEDLPHRAPRLGGPRRSRGCRPPPLLRWWIGKPVWMSASNYWGRLCRSINKVTWMQRNNPRTRDPAAGRFPEHAVWISSHKSQIWSRSRHVVAFTAAACLSSESLCSRTL